MGPFDTEDECSGCEGWADVNADGLCSGCAYELANDPWHVVQSVGGAVVKAGPLTSEQAELQARVHNHSLRYADHGELWSAESAS